MKTPLAPFWRKERYSYQEALKIVAWWRYGPDDDSLHPGADAKIGREARQNADRDIRPLLQRDKIPDQPPSPRISRRESDWLQGSSPKDPWLRSGFGKPGWGFNDKTSDDFGRFNLPPPAWLAFEDLAALCPGVFGDSGRGTSDASASGQALARLSHAENIACRQQIEDWDREHGHLYQNATKAADAAVQAKLVPVAYRTIYIWILARRKRK